MIVRCARRGGYDPPVTQIPWWGVSVVAGAFTVGGVVVAQVVAITPDRARARGEDARRWQADRRKNGRATTTGVRMRRICRHCGSCTRRSA